MGHEKPTYNESLKILCVSRTSTRAEIKANFKRLSLRWHPDRNQSNPKLAHEKYIRILEAYKVLMQLAPANSYSQTRFYKEHRENNEEFKRTPKTNRNSFQQNSNNYKEKEPNESKNDFNSSQNNENMNEANSNSQTRFNQEHREKNEEFKGAPKTNKNSFQKNSNHNEKEPNESKNNFNSSQNNENTNWEHDGPPKTNGNARDEEDPMNDESFSSTNIPWYRRIFRKDKFRLFRSVNLRNRISKSTALKNCCSKTWEYLPYILGTIISIAVLAGVGYLLYLLFDWSYPFLKEVVLFIYNIVYWVLYGVYWCLKMIFFGFYNFLKWINGLISPEKDAGTTLNATTTTTQTLIPPNKIIDNYY